MGVKIPLTKMLHLKERFVSLRKIGSLFSAYKYLEKSLVKLHVKIRFYLGGQGMISHIFLLEIQSQKVLSEEIVWSFSWSSDVICKRISECFDKSRENKNQQSNLHTELFEMNRNQCVQVTRMVGTEKGPKSPFLEGYVKNKPISRHNQGHNILTLLIMPRTRGFNFSHYVQEATLS